MAKPELIVLPRNILSQYRTPRIHCIVSITNSNFDWPEVNQQNLRGLLRLKFDDFMEQEEPWQIIFDGGHARVIWEFVNYHWDKVEEILVGCLAGWSRSPAVAAAIAKIKFGDDKKYWREYGPNRLVYEKMMEVGENWCTNK